MTCFWAEANHGNFRPLLQGTEWKHAEVTEVDVRQWKSVGDKRKVQKTCRSKWKTRKGSGRPRRGQEGCGRGQKKQEDLGK